MVHVTRSQNGNITCFMRQDAVTTAPQFDSDTISKLNERFFNHTLSLQQRLEQEEEIVKCVYLLGRDGSERCIGTLKDFNELYFNRPGALPRACCGAEGESDGGSAIDLSVSTIEPPLKGHETATRRIAHGEGWIEIPEAEYPLPMDRGNNEGRG